MSALEVLRVWLHPRRAAEMIRCLHGEAASLRRQRTLLIRTLARVLDDSTVAARVDAMLADE